jgi:hypothetical protein
VLGSRGERRHGADPSVELTRSSPTRVQRTVTGRAREQGTSPRTAPSEWLLPAQRQSSSRRRSTSAKDGQHLVKEPTETDGNQRYSCDT